VTKANQKQPDRSKRDAIPINRQTKPQSELPLAVRELADLLAELAVMQLDANLNDSNKEQ
jgi:hypothetical protein